MVGWQQKQELGSFSGGDMFQQQLALGSAAQPMAAATPSSAQMAQMMQQMQQMQMQAQGFPPAVAPPTTPLIQEVATLCLACNSNKHITANCTLLQAARGEANKRTKARIAAQDLVKAKKAAEELLAGGEDG